jgi:hypothetical protein
MRRDAMRDDVPPEKIPVRGHPPKIIRSLRSSPRIARRTGATTRPWPTPEETEKDFQRSIAGLRRLDGNHSSKPPGSTRRTVVSGEPTSPPGSSRRF